MAPGVIDANVNYAAATLGVRLDTSVIAPSRVEEIVHDAGYEAAIIDDASKEPEDRGRGVLRTRLAVAAFFTIASMLPEMIAHLAGKEPSDPHVACCIALIAGILTVPVVSFSAWPFIVRALRSIRDRAPGMDLLIATGAVTTFGYSVVVLATGSSLVYFSTAGAIVAFLLLGRVIEDSARRRSVAAVRLLHALAPNVTHLIGEDTQEIDVATSSVPVGAKIRIRPGERIPLDGRVAFGSSNLDRSLLTGESTPVAVGANDVVEAGTLNLDGALVVEVVHTVGNRSLDEVARSVDLLLSHRAPMQALADRVAGKLTVVVLVVASATALATWIVSHDVATALARAVAVTVIACPCALGLATPMAVLVAAGRSARRGILFRDGASIERTADVTALLFDKTGTLTVGHPTVRGVIAASGHTRDEVLACAAMAEASSEHPVARAIVHAAPKVEANGSTRAIAGHGVEWIGDDGHCIRVGRRTFVASSAGPEPVTPHTVAHVSRDGEWIGVIVVDDPPRSEARRVVAEMRRRGLRIAMITGDRREVADDVAGRLGITEVVADCDPAEKARTVERWRQDGEVVGFAGDGLNDGPALAAADVGFAIDRATDVAQAAASVVLRGGGIEQILVAVDIARATRRIMRQNLAWALVYNSLAIPGAVAGFIPPSVAAFAMAASSLSVVANSLRLASRRLTGNTGSAALPSP